METSKNASPSLYETYRAMNQQIRGTRDQIAQAVLISDNITKGQLNALILSKWGMNYQGSRDTMITERTSIILADVAMHEVGLAFTMAKEVLATSTVTPFNVADVMLGRGYSMEYFSKGEPIEVSMRGKSFKKTITEYVTFTNGNASPIVLPISSTYLDTNYLPEQPKVTIPKFNMVLALTINIVASYNFISNNVVKLVTFSPNANNLTSMDKLVKSGGTAAAAMLLFHYINERKDRSDNKIPTSIAGAKFAHEAYTAIMEAIEFDANVEKRWFVQFNACLIEPMVSTKQQDGLTVHSLKYKVVEPPLYLNEKEFNIAKRTITIPQAYEANTIARSIRGENDTEKAVFSRIANLPFTVPYRVGEACTMKANIMRYISGFHTVFADADKTVVQTVLSDFLDSLVMCDYNGVVFLPDHASRIVGMVADFPSLDMKSTVDDFGKLSYTYRSSKMKVILYPFERIEILRKQFTSTDLVIDFKVISNVEGQYSTKCASINYLGAQRAAFHSSYKYSFVFIIPLVDGMTDWIFADGKGKDKAAYLRSGYQITNLRAFYSNYEPDLGLDKWSYNLLNAEEVSIYCSAAALVTILRCVYKFTGRTPNYYLDYYKFKTLPIVVKGMAKIGANVLLTMKLQPGVFQDMDLDELRAVFDTATIEQRTEILMACPEVLERMVVSEEGASSVSPSVNGMASVIDSYTQEI